MAVADIARRLQQAQQGFGTDLSQVVDKGAASRKTGQVKYAQQSARNLASGVSAGQQSIEDILSQVKAQTNTNTQQGAADVSQSVGNVLAASQRTPFDINQPPQLSQGVQNAVDVAGQQASAQFQGQGEQIGREIGSQQAETEMDYANRQAQVQSWRRQKELEALARYQDIRRALQTELAGSNLETRLQLAQMAANAFNEDLGAINNIVRGF